MNNKVTTDDQLKRMKALMNYGINESKQPVYSSVEYSKVAADGKLYGIVREGTNYFIKVAKNPKGGLISENFDYINGFRNRSDNKFDSFASAQRFFGEKMMGINESVGDAQKRVIAEAWDLNEKKEVIEEQTKKIQDEIARQRQIMENVVLISEKKGQKTEKAKQEFKEVKGKDADKNSESPKCKAKGCECTKDYHDKKIKGGVGAPFNYGVKCECCCESTEIPLSSRKNPEYMDRSHGTELGDNTGFEMPIEEDGIADAVTKGFSNSMKTESVMHTSQNQNDPAVGTSEIGDDDPFDEKVTVTESLDDIDDTLEDDEENIADDEANLDADEAELEADEEPEDTEFELELDSEPEEEETSELEDRIDNLEDKLDDILSAIEDMKYDDNETLYDDEEEPEDEEGDEDFGDEEDGDFEDGEEDGFDDEEADDFDDEDEDEDTNVVESRSYRAMRHRMMNEGKKDKEWQEKFNQLFGGNPFDEKGCKELGLDAEELYSGKKTKSGKKLFKKDKIKESSLRRCRRMNEENRLNDFGKHPAYQKKVMTLPSNDNIFRDGQYDMNDDSVYNDKPYGTSKGSQAPFDKSAQDIEDSIVESVYNIIKKKLG